MTIKILISRRKLFMKLNKKFLASFTALTMAVTPMAAYADAANGTTSASSITGTGYVSTLDTEIYNVVLPTSDSINFNVDPYGLLDVAKSTTATSLKDVVSNAAGTVTSKATAVINKSSVGINVSVDVYLDNKDVSNSAVKLASSKEEAENGTADLYLVVENLSGASLDKSTVATNTAADLTSSAIDVTANAIDLSGKAFTLSNQALTVTGSYINVTAAVVTATGPAATATGAAATTPITFSLGDISEAYFVSASAISNAGVKAEAVLSEGAVTYTSNNVYAFDITGYANPNSTVWNDIKDSGLKLTMKFTISKQTTEPEVVKTADGGTVEFNITDPSFTFTIDTTANITSVYNTKVAYTLSGATIKGQTVTITNGTDTNSTWLFSNATTAALTLVLSDGTTYTVNVVGK
jgi:hypothetical protein